MEKENLLFERFKDKLEAVSGECYRVKTATEAGDLISKILGKKGVHSVAIVNSPLTQLCDLKNKLSLAGVSVHMDRYKDVTPTVGAGITEVKWAIAELGTLVQFAEDVNDRLCSSFTPIHVALVPTTVLLPSLMETLREIQHSPQIPGFVGFITGPSRTSDIERVLTIGVHGPEQLIAIFIDELPGEVA